jgi:hypothetical protein
MTRNVGVWIDHKQAYLIWEKEGKMEVIPSNVQPRVNYSGSRRIGGLYNPGMDSELRYYDRYEHQLREYYEKVLAALAGADAIFVMGPGEAKIELEKMIQKNKDLSKRLVEVAPADKMTEGQMMARVREFFAQMPKNQKSAKAPR